MCRMSLCCFMVSVRVGVFVASVYEGINGIVEVVLYCTIYAEHRKEEAEKALILIFICALLMASVLAMLGSVKEERIFVILHSIFLGVALFSDFFLQLALFGFSYFSCVPDWLVAYKIFQYLVLVYVLPVNGSYAVQLKYAQDDLPQVPRQRLLSSVMSSEIYGM